MDKLERKQTNCTLERGAMMPINPRRNIIVTEFKISEQSGRSHYIKVLLNRCIHRRLTLFLTYGGTSVMGILDIIIWLIIGGIVGWLASKIMGTDAQQGILMNIVVGIVGAFLAGIIITPLIGGATINEGFSIVSFIISLLGAIVLLAIVNLFRRGRTRRV